MTNCSYCGADVTGKKFCAGCGHAVQTASPNQTVSTSCPQCGEKINPGAAFCMHCGTALHTQATPVSFSATRSCPSCQAQVAQESGFCTTCGHDMRAGAASPAMQHCTTCGQSNAPGMRFCGGCGSPLGTPAASQPYGQPQYQQPGSQPYGQPQQYQQQNPQPYNQSQQYQQPGSQPYGQPQYQQQYNNQGNQGGYQPQPMMGQGPMVLRCPVCMAMAPMGSSNCQSCHTSLLNIVPTPANMPPQGQQGGGFLQGQQGGGFLQGNVGKYAAGALGGAAAVIGGEMLFNGLENSIENRVEGDMGYGENRHHRHHQRENEGILGELGRLANDVGL